MRPVLTLLLLALTTKPLTGQVPAWAPDTSAFRRLELPALSALRTAAAKPGPGYWQQRVDYVSRASLDTAARSLRGEERITYANNSPDTLRHLWLHLEQNLFTPDSLGHRVFDQRTSYGEGAGRGVRLIRVRQPARPAVRGGPPHRRSPCPTWSTERCCA